MPTVKENEDEEGSFNLPIEGNDFNDSPGEISKNNKNCKGKEQKTIEIKNYIISGEPNEVFLNGSLLIDGKRYGLVGLDSCKITCLLKHVAEIESGIDVIYWDESIVDKTLPAMDAVIKPTTRCEELLKERENLFNEQDNGNDSEIVRNRLSQIWEELLFIDPEGRPARKRAAEILGSLQIVDIEETVENIAEHLRKRIALARALYLEPTLLILNEPTAELDIDSIIWLEK